MMNSINNNVLISGINGFVGVNLKNYLKKDYTITGLSRVSNEEIQIITYEELTVDFLNNVKAFIHLAGKAHDLKKTAKDNEYFKVNTELTKKVFEAFLKSECEVFIFLSSVKAVADKMNGILYETKQPNPITAYGKSKLLAEQYILSKELPKNKKVYILRSCMIHGTNNKGNLNLLYNLVDKKIPFPLGRFNNKRSFLSIDNLCFIVEELLKSKPESGVFNVADDDSLSTNELVRLIGEVNETPVRILKWPKILVSMMAFIGEILPLPLNRERLEKLTENYCVSNAKIKEVLNKELPLSTQEGLVKTIRSFKEEKEYVD